MINRLIERTLRWTPLLALLLTLGAPTVAIAGAPGLQWSAPKQIDGAPPYTSGFNIESVSCPTTTLCAAIDQGGNVMTSSNPDAGQWTFPTPLGGGLVDIDCPAANLCVVVEGSGDILTSTNPAGGVWSRAKLGAGGLASVSCPTTTFCAAVGTDGQVVTSTNPTAGGAAWTRTQTTAGQLDDVSCASPSFCVAVVFWENAIVTSTNPTGGPGAWTKRQLGTKILRAIACPSTSLCVAGGEGGTLHTTTDPTSAGATWTTVTQGVQWIQGLDCPSTTFCAAATGWGGQVLTSTTPTAGGWSGKELTPAGTTMLNAVSCPSANLCVGGDSKGFAHVSTAPAAAVWSTVKISGVNVLNAVSCASAGFCAATDDAGRVLTSADPSGAWTGAMIDSSAPLRDIDCPTPNFCVAIGGVGFIRTSTNPTGGEAAWPRIFVNTIHQLVAVSCPSAGFCAVIDASGSVFTSTSPTGGQAAWTRTYLGAIGTRSLACASPSLCVIGDSIGNLRISTTPGGGADTWGRTQLDTRHEAGNYTEVNDLSCPTTTFCAATDFSQRIHTSTNPTGGVAAWKSTRVTGAYPDAISCPTSTFCAGTEGLRVYSSLLPGGDPGDWAIRDAPGDLTGMDCVSASLCVAVTGRGEVLLGTPAAPKTLTVQKSGQGTVTSAPAGIACGNDCTGDFADGATVTLTATAPAGSRFEGWSGACTGTATCQVDMLAAAGVTATFTPTPALTVSKAGSGSGTVTSAPAGIDCGTTCSARIDEVRDVTLTSVAAAGSRFAGWSGACTGTATCVVRTDVARNVTATFIATATLTVTTAGTSGTLTSSPAGINCGATCSAAFDQGTTVRLIATGTGSSRFTGWSGACTGTVICEVTMSQARNVTATFALRWSLRVRVSGTGDGTVTSDPAGIDCPWTICNRLEVDGSVVTFTATPDAGSHFAGWSGGGCTGTAPCRVVFNADTELRAVFTQGEAPPAPTPTPTPTPEPTPTATPTPDATPTPSPEQTVVPRPGPSPSPTAAQSTPDTRMGKKTVKQRTATLRFSATGTATGFRCALTARGKKVVYKTCRSPVTFKKLKPGKYTFRVAAIGDPTPATTSITVRRR